MAYVPTIIKNNVKEINADNHILSINVSIVDDQTSEEVFNQNASVRYNDNWTIGDVRTKLQNIIKEKWDRFLREKNLFDNVAFDSMITQIDTALTAYIN